MRGEVTGGLHLCKHSEAGGCGFEVFISLGRQRRLLPVYFGALVCCFEVVGGDGVENVRGCDEFNS